MFDDNDPEKFDEYELSRLDDFALKRLRECILAGCPHPKKHVKITARRCKEDKEDADLRPWRRGYARSSTQEKIEANHAHFHNVQHDPDSDTEYSVASNEK